MNLSQFSRNRSYLDYCTLNYLNNLVKELSSNGFCYSVEDSLAKSLIGRYEDEESQLTKTLRIDPPPAGQISHLFWS